MLGSDPTTVNVSWTAPLSGASVTGYRIYYQTEGDQGSVDVGASTTQHVLSGLDDGMNCYSIYLVALSVHLPSQVVGPIVIKLGELWTVQLKFVICTKCIVLLRISCTLTRLCMCWAKFSPPVLYLFTTVPWLAFIHILTYTQQPLRRHFFTFYFNTGNTNETNCPNVTTSPITINSIVVTCPSTISPVATTSSDAFNFTSTTDVTSTSSFISTPDSTSGENACSIHNALLKITTTTQGVVSPVLVLS